MKDHSKTITIIKNHQFPPEVNETNHFTAIQETPFHGMKTIVSEVQTHGDIQYFKTEMEIKFLNLSVPSKSYEVITYLHHLK